MATAPSLIAFGSLTPWPAPERLKQLRDSLRQQPLLTPVVEAIHDLKSLWTAVVTREPGLDVVANPNAADQLVAWITGFDCVQIVEEKRNAMTMPMTIIEHIVQYFSYIQQSDGVLTHSLILESVAAGGGIQGFCAGLLSAVAVAGGKTQQEVGINAATSIRLAFCVGAYIDLDQSPDGGDSKVSTLAVRWRTPTTLESIQRVLLNHPGTYIAVVRDVRDVTITTPTSAMTALCQDLLIDGTSALDTGLCGRYHASIHRDVPNKILAACNSFVPHFGDQYLVRSNTDGQILPKENTALVILQCVLVDCANWYSTISTAASSLNEVPGKPFMLSIGTDAIPQSITRSFQVAKVTTNVKKINGMSESAISPEGLHHEGLIDNRYLNNAIAVVGMACKFPGADSADEFWSLLTEGKSMLGQMPKERFAIDGLPRSNGDFRFWGNFVRDIDAFDHKLFKKSSREAASMDPQQRLLLQVAYEALESSGYFADPTKPRNIGCYLGACSTDYDHNVASHPPTAYSTIGTLRAFLSGKISHYFGWSGPSLTFDTACSSSAVAIHTACTALPTDECSQAMAGGVTLLTSPYLYENLATAHFLSPTGATKPFDATADGYCRGEGLGLVVLKRLSDALTNGDAILGIVASSAINQNDNCVPITVPHSSSQGTLYKRVVDQAGILPNEVTFVEAHGTGTPVGDPIEMESIRHVFGGQMRSAPLFVSSVKGNIGHLEGASGVAALIKALLQIEHRTACTQASFKSLNTKIPALEPDKICIPTSNRALPGDILTACINNYGAAGSNAAMMLVEAPRKHMWQQSSLLRSHLDLCDEILRSMGYQGLYPGIFQVESVTDMAALHSMVFSIQYACAQAWLNSGLRVDALIGHSIGQIAALCVSGVLSLRDGLILIAGRASLMRKHWGSESGTMIAVETDQLSIEELTKSLTAVNVRHQFEIACYNGPTSHVIVSDEMSADELEAKLVQRGIRHKRLNVAYGFHSRFTDPLLPHLENLASSLVFNEAKIPLETCTDKVSWSKPTAQLIASHTRDAVFFGQAVQRLYSRLGVCTWLEAGSESSVVGMVRRVFGHSSPDARNNFVPMQLNKPNSLELLVDTTLELWNHGHQVQFWNFHRLQTLDYDVLRLPSYRFEKSRHWLKLITAPPADSSPTASVSHSDMATSIASLVLFIRFVGMDSQGQHFDINPRSEEYQAHVKGHIVMGSALCPSMLYVEMASRAIRIAEETKASCPLSVQDLRIESPLDRATDKKISVDLQRLVGAWSFRITSKSISPSVPKHTTAVCHATGVVSLSAPGKSLQEDFARYERLTGHDQIAAVFEDGRSESVQGTMVYKVFSSVVSYSDCYRGVKSMASKGSRVVGRVSLPKDSPESFKNSLVQPHILDNFIQVASLFANCIYEGCEDETFWLTRVDRIQSGPDFESRCTEGFPDAAWDVLAFNSTGAVGMTSDIFVYDAATRRMVLFILGARFTNSRRVPLAELLSRADEASADITIIRKKPHVTEIAPAAGRTVQTNVSPIDSRPYAELDREARGSNPSIHDDICALLEKLADIPRDQVAGNASFDDLGVDSLMMIEVINNLSTLFHIDLPHEDLEQLTDIDSLVQYLHGRGCVGSTRITSSSTYATSSSGTSASSVGSIAIATPPEIPSDDGIDESLCRLVAEHLEMETALTLSTNLVDHGLDSLLCIELQSDIRKHFSVEIDIEKLDHESTFADLLKMVLEDGRTARVTAADSAIIAVTSGSNLATDAKSTIARDENLAADVQAEDGVLRDAQQAFENIRFDFDKHAEQTHFKDFWKVVYPKQANLVLAFVVEAFRNLGCDLAGQSDGQQLPSIDVLPKHGHLLNRLRKILVDGGLISRRTDHLHVRTSKPIDSTPAATLSEQMLEQCPWNASETKLLNVTASRLTDCLTGNVDPLQLLFANKANRNIVADVYEYAPMCQATTRLLAEFLLRIFSASPRDGIFRILEVGAGTGGTARYLVDFLTVRGIRFEYTFTDISSALVNAAKKRFSGNDAMRFMALDCGRTAEPALLNKFDVVIATNCIHATANATVSSANIATMLRDDGVFCLVEFTRDLYWFDLVYGLLEGWWLFSDGRQHALADEWFWDRSLRSAGYKHVSWTDGTSKEAQTMRLICSFKGNAEKSSYTPASRTLPKRAGIPMETFVWKRVGNLDLQADVYFPKTADEGVKTRPIALMVHGGGHFLFSRKDIPMKHVRVLLQRGFLPISVDYRLCPEVNLFEGPITDVCDSLQWIRETLPSLQFCGPIVRIDPDKVIAIGWSSGGQLVMTLGYMASTRGIRPPDAILALYSPTDLESDHWDRPIFPAAAEEGPTEIWGILDGVRDQPIVEYAPISDKRTTALSLTLKDDRARIILHMNWKAQSVPILIHGLPNKKMLASNNETDWKNLPKPSTEKIRQVSPYWQILQGNYRTPTAIVHGNRDDWIPFQMSQRTVAALQAQGVPACIEIPDGCGHAFDLFAVEDRLGLGWASVDKAYDFSWYSKSHKPHQYVRSIPHMLQHFLYPVSVMIITVAANRHIVNPQFEKLNKGHDKLNKGLKRLELKLEKHCQAEKDKIDRLTQVVDKVKEDVIEVKHDLEKLQDRIDTKHSAIPVEGMVIA